MSQKVSWVFGKAPLSKKMQEANRNAIIDVKNYIENNNATISTQITDSISWVKGMFNRTIKKIDGIGILYGFYLVVLFIMIQIV